jgi:hypothetical protein
MKVVGHTVNWNVQQWVEMMNLLESSVTEVVFDGEVPVHYVIFLCMAQNSNGLSNGTIVINIVLCV